MAYVKNPGDWRKIDGPWVFTSHAKDMFKMRYSFDDAMLHELERNLIEENFVQVPENSPEEGKYLIQIVVRHHSMFLVIPFGEKLVITALPPFCHFDGEIVPPEERYPIGDRVSPSIVKSVAERKPRAPKIERRDDMISLDQTYYEFVSPENDGLKPIGFTKEKEAQKARDYLGIVGAAVEKKTIKVDIYESFAEFKKEHENRLATQALARLDPKEREAIEAYYAGLKGE